MAPAAYRLRHALTAFLGVALFGVLPGILMAVGLSVGQRVSSRLAALQGKLGKVKDCRESTTSRGAETPRC